MISTGNDVSNVQLRAAENGLSKKIIGEYEGVRKIKFDKWGHSSETGMWYVVAEINDTDEISFALSDVSAQSIRSEVTDGHFSLKNRSEKMSADNISLKHYNIIHSTR